MNKTAKIIVFSILTVLYLASIITMFFDFGLGLVLWGVALVPSLIVFLIQRHQDSMKDEETIAELENKEEESKEENK